MPPIVILRPFFTLQLLVLLIVHQNFDWRLLQSSYVWREAHFLLLTKKDFARFGWRFEAKNFQSSLAITKITHYTLPKCIRISLNNPNLYSFVPVRWQNPDLLLIPYSYPRINKYELKNFIQASYSMLDRVKRV